MYKLWVQICPIVDLFEYLSTFLYTREYGSWFNQQVLPYSPKALIYSNLVRF